MGPFISGLRLSQWPCGLRLRSADSRILRLWIRIPPGTWMSVCWERSVLSGRGLYDELITRPKESYRLWCVVVCDLETSRMRRPRPTGNSCTSNITHRIFGIKIRRTPMDIRIQFQMRTEQKSVTSWASRRYSLNINIYITPFVYLIIIK